MSELEAFVYKLSKKLDSDSVSKIEQTLKVNGFTTRLQIKLISEKDLDTMFKGSVITMGAKNLLSYHIQLLRDESPLVVKSKQKSSSSAPVSYTGTAIENGELSLDDSDSDTYDRIDKQPKSKGVLPALHTQRQRLKDQMTKERQECLELEMNVESMLIEVKEPPPIGKSRLVCGYCHHRGHRNSGSQPCKMKKCTEYTYCGLKDKHPEYFSKLNSLKVELKKKKSALQEIETAIT